jgi:transcriptional regulator with GAF, ATPase, and Fis domain
MTERRQERRSAERLLTLAGAVLAETNLGGVLTVALDGLIELVGAERGMVLLFAADGSESFETARRIEREDLERPEWEVSRGIIERVRESGEAFWSPNALDEPGLSGRGSVLRLRILSVICQPIRHADATLGVVYLDHRKAAGVFEHEDAVLAARFAELISAAAGNALERRRLERQVETLSSRLARGERFPAIVGHHSQMAALLDLVGQFADTEATVLVRGESGTGKELVARALHAGSRRRERPFVAVNCAALPDTLLESELFGHVRGAFTGAVRDNPGWFERARGGTLFLDEVGELAPPLQAKLLRVLETGELSPVGGSRTVATDVRLVAATNQDLDELVREGRVRQDFLYRLKVLELIVPPLHERASDLPALVAHLLAELGERHRRPGRRLSAAAAAALAKHRFPGNVRELKNALERGLLVAPGEVIELDHLPESVRGRGDARPAAGTPVDVGFREAKQRAVEGFERDFLARCLARTAGNVSAAARLAAIDYKNFYTKMRRLGVDPAAFKAPP